jgi:hypothetical protein
LCEQRLSLTCPTRAPGLSLAGRKRMQYQVLQGTFNSNSTET